jgi:hypothetical protein
MKIVAGFNSLDGWSVNEPYQLYRGEAQFRFIIERKMPEKSMTFQTSLDVSVNRAIPENSKNIKFDSDSYRVFMLIEDGQNLYEVYKKSDLNNESFVQAVKKLYAQGLIYKVTPGKYISHKEIESIKSSLAAYVGPVAQLMMDNAMTSLGFTKEKLPKLKVELLIEKIADEIPFDKALEFKENVKYMLNPVS